MTTQVPGTGTLPQLGQEREEGGYNCHAGWSNSVVKRFIRRGRDWQVRGSSRNHAHSVCERQRAFTGRLDTSPRMPAGRFDNGQSPALQFILNLQAETGRLQVTAQVRHNYVAILTTVVWQALHSMSQTATFSHTVVTEVDVSTSWWGCHYLVCFVYSTTCSLGGQITSFLPNEKSRVLPSIY
jgi:hypothetical protein